MRVVGALLWVQAMVVLLCLEPLRLRAMVRTEEWDGEGRSLPPCPALCNCSFSPFLAFPQPLLTVQCEGAGLRDLPANLPNATQALLLPHNRLQNLSSLPPLTNLYVLDLAHNRISFLDNHWVFEHLGQLVHLNLSGNSLRRLQHGSFSGLQNLDVLDLSDNHIDTIEVHAFGGLNHLSVLHLGYNQLYSIKRPWLLSMVSLQELYLQSNHIARIEQNTFDKLTSLLHVDLSNNALVKVEEEGFLGLHHVKTLILSGNDLTSIPTQELRRLLQMEILLLDGIKVQALPEGSFEDLRLSHLSLSFLPRLRLVERGAFTNLTNLRKLQLHDNHQLLFIHPQALRGVPELRKLFLHNDGLITLSARLRESLPLLQELHLYHNPLHCDCNIFWLRRDMQQEASNGTDGEGYIQNADKLVCNSPEASGERLLWQVPLEQLGPVCPPTTLPFFNSHLNISVGDDLILECQAIGVPPPTLTWMLPDGSSPSPGGDGHAVMSGDGTLLTVAGMGLEDGGTYACCANSSAGYDFNSVAVVVANRNLNLLITDAANNYITVSWAGSVPRLHMDRFQIVYRRVEGGEADRVYLHSNMHRCTLAGLQPLTPYEVCLVYRERFVVQCHNVTTQQRLAMAAAGITRINLTRVVASVCSVLGALSLLCLARIAVRRMRRRKDYHDPLHDNADMDKIPLEPIDNRSPATPLCSSRTALLPNSQI